MLALAFLLAAQTPDACSVGARPLEQALPQLRNFAGARALLAGARVVRGEAKLEVDERVEPITLALPRAALDVTLPLALPAGAQGTVRYAAAFESRCVQARAVWQEDELVRIELLAPMTAHIAASYGERSSARPLALETLTLGRLEHTLHMSEGGARHLFPGRTLPSAGTLIDEPSLALHYVLALRAFDLPLEDALEADASRAARGLRFALQAIELRLEHPLKTPQARAEIAASIEPASLPAELRPLARFWKRELAAAPVKSDARARFLIGDDVDAVYVEGAAVFERSLGASTSVEVPAAREGVRVWIVSRTADKKPFETQSMPPSAPFVFDVRAVLAPGAIYNIGAMRLVPVEGGARRECVRVRGRIDSASGVGVLRWRELGSPPGPLLAADEAFRPSGGQDLRQIGVVDRAQRAARVPPIPLVYAYTQPGTYEWTVTPDGAVSLRVLPDVKLCAEGGDDVAAP